MSEENKVKYTFVSDKEFPAEHALSGNHTAGEVIELDADIAAPFVEEGILAAEVGENTAADSAAE